MTVGALYRNLASPRPGHAARGGRGGGRGGGRPAHSATATTWA
ncbi:MAG: hypothetical protein WKG07_14020 [Hymenobacter sp.]